MVAVNTDAASLIASKGPVVAVVEDDDVFREYLSVLFRTNNCQVKEASCGRDLFEILAAQHVDCVILDYNLATENGLSIHAQIKEAMPAAPPIVMLTMEKNERTIIKAFRGGVSDYVLKSGFKPAELFTAVNKAIERQAQTVAHDAEIARLKRKSEFDDATGLYSRESIDGRLAEIIKSRHNGRCAIILIAIDNMDSIREKFGAVVADRGRRAFVSRLKGSLGRYDIGGCYDSERFISITDVDVRFKTIELTCRKLAQELSLDVNLDTAGFRLVPAIGAAIYPQTGRTIEEVFAAAEEALRNAQASGMPFAIAEGPPGTERARAAGPLVDAARAPAGGGSASALTRAEAPAERKGDRRSVPRQRVLKRGQIVMSNLYSGVDCTIRDISPKGARLRVEGYFVAPDRFELVFLGTGERKMALRRWQNGNEFGVQFID